MERVGEEPRMTGGRNGRGCRTVEQPGDRHRTFVKLERLTRSIYDTVLGPSHRGVTLMVGARCVTSAAHGPGTIMQR
jgi:hypothetical protein